MCPRTAKSIPLSPQVRAALDVDAEQLTPNELIRAILRAPVDLLWNGGIGTYVKASTETHADVGDKANDAVRVDAARAALPRRRRGRQPRLHAARADRVRARRRAHQHRRDRQRRRRQLLRPRGQHQDPARLGRRRRRPDAQAAQRAAGRDDRRGRRARAARQLHADAGAEPRARAGAGDARRARPADAQPRADAAGSTARSRRCPTPRRSPSAARPGSGSRSPSWRCCSPTARSRSTRRCSTPTCPRTPALADELARYFPAPLPERFGEQHGAAPAAARDHRHARDQRHGRPRRHDVRVPAAARTPARRRRTSRAPTRSRATCSRCARCGRRSRRSTCEVDADDADRDAAREPPARRARDALAAAHAPAPARHRGRDRALRRRRAGGRRARCPTCSSRPTASSGTRASRELAGDGVPEELAGRVATLGALFSALDIVEVADGDGALGATTSRRCTSCSARACTCTGCATGSPRCRATTAGRRWRARRCATTCSRCTPS